jgi:hypothetical protein
MGSRKFIILVLSTMFFSGCYTIRNVSISNCTIVENSIIIEIDLKNVKIFEVTGVYIDYKHIPISVKFLDEDEITCFMTNSKIVINLCLTNKGLYINEKAELIISVSGGFIYGDILIEYLNANAEPFYSFPNTEYEYFRINILNQGYGLHH